MNKIKRVFLLLLTLSVLFLLPASMASAESGPVSKLKMTARTEDSITLSWSEASGADGYTVYAVNGSTYTKLKTLTKTSCTLKNLVFNQEYTFQVFSYSTENGTNTYCTTGSPTLTVTMSAITPDKVKNFRVGSTLDRGFILLWDEVSNCSGYAIYQYNPTTKEYKRIATTTKTRYTVTGLKKNKTYYFKIASYRTYNGTHTFSEQSSAVKAASKKINMSSIHSRYWYGTTNTSFTAKAVSTGKKKKIPKGASVVITKTGDTTATFTYKGKSYTCKKSLLTYKDLKWTSKYYSQSQAEAFVNSKGYSSDTKYLIWISQYTSAVYVFKGSQYEWKMVRKCPAVIGREGNTPIKNYTIIKYGYQYGDVFLYIAWFGSYTGGYGFHARVSSRSRGAASGGCIRLGTSDLHYLYDNCKLGTKVISY